MARAGKISTALAATAVLSAGALLFAQGASAAPTTCRLDPVTHVLSLSIVAAPRDRGFAHVERVGDRIEVSQPLESVPCGEPTVTTVDRIEIAADRFVELSLDLEGGALVPGLTPELDGYSEIEVFFSGGATLEVEGGDGADRFKFLGAEGATGLNVEAGAADGDVDIGVLGPIQNVLPILAKGGRGADTLEVVGPLRAVVAMQGEGGDDTLRAEDAPGALLIGDAGRDRIFGSRGSDVILPGAGPDVVQALGGSDHIEVERDRKRDMVDCGGGKDFAGLPDPFDRLRSCEQTVAGGSRP